ncbi:lycopene cyclase domain-containing protein [Mucilaginibacter sp.]
MKFTYLLINFFTILFPLTLSFDKKVQFYKKWKFVWPGLLITGLVFLFWDVLFTVDDVWSFNTKYITGITISQLPIEEIFFFLTVPFACIFIYACLNYYIKWEMDIRLTRIISNLIIIFSILILILYPHRLYTRVTFTLLAFLVILFQFIYKIRWLNRFYITFLVVLIPFYIINGILTAWPVVMYNNAQNLGLRIGTIPVEDHFYCMALLLMNIGFFEYFRLRSIKIHYA